MGGKGSYSIVIVVVVLMKISSPVLAKPAKDAEPGPCVGMDCLHGVLMHDDTEQAGDHKAEDQYLRFKEALKTGEVIPGPQDAAQEFHGVLMHGDTEPGHAHEESADILPEVKQEVLPKDLSEQMHEGMHGSEGVHKHDWDNDDSKDNVANTGAMDHEKIMHGLLMHGDENHGEHDSKSSDEAKTDEINDPYNHDKLMHGLLMHGDENHGEHTDEESSENSNNIGPKTASEQLHGVLMHGDEEQGSTHEHGDSSSQEQVLSSKTSGPTPNLLHGILMHGDTEMGHDHAEEDGSAVHDVFSDYSKLLELAIELELLQTIDLASILKNDIADYVDWKTSNPEHEDAKIMGSTYIDQSLLEDIELMKRRYLDRVDNDDTILDDVTDDVPFTAEDANSVLSGHAHGTEGEDMRHDLELMGSTDPINDRHAEKHNET